MHLNPLADSHVQFASFVSKLCGHLQLVWFAHQTIPCPYICAVVCFMVRNHLSFEELFHVETPLGYSQGRDTFLKKSQMSPCLTDPQVVGDGYPNQTGC
jgi:hypothetical protein